MLLECKNIKKYFPVKSGTFGQSRSVVKAVDGVDLSVQKGQNLSLVGESGCGKTTLARIMIKLIKQDSGNLFFQGQDVSRCAPKKFRSLRKDIQIVFQDPYSSLDPRWTVRRILKEGMGLDRQHFAAKKDLEDILAQALTAVQLKPDMLNRHPHEFSGGERQRIAIARALILNPKLLILDEAVSSLDVIIQQQIMDLLDQLQHKHQLTYVFISHNLKVVKKISRRIAVMYKGKIVEMAATDKIFERPLHPYTQDLLKAAVDYTSSNRTEPIQLDPYASLKDQGGGHYLLA